jgi:hypothetical protein
LHMPASQEWRRKHKMIMLDEDAQCKKNPPPKGEGVTILDLRLSSCRYVTGAHDEVGAIFCGAAVHRVSYCQAHYSLCYIKTKPIKF